MNTIESRPELEVDEIDEIAVAFVAEDGLRMRLRGRDRDEAIRRMHGRVDTELIAWRLHISSRTVDRVIARIASARTEHHTLAVAA